MKPNRSLLRTCFAIITLLVMSLPNLAAAEPFTMRTGYFVGDGTDNRAITGLGFSPDLVLIKDDTNNGAEGLIFKTSSMAGELSLVLAETDANLTTNHIQSLDSDGFTVGNDADVNGANIMQYWVAFDGSDCTSTGTFCVGSYTGNGTTQGITSVGFQPDLVVIKRSGATVGIWKSSSMGGTVSNFFNAAAELASAGINSLDATGFTVGNNAAVNTSADTYYYFAFKNVAGQLDVGTYTGNGADNRNITSTDDAGLTFQPDFAFVKVTTAVGGVASVREHYGDRSFVFDDNNSAANHIQSLRSAGGFQVGASTSVNTNLSTHHFAVFGGAVPQATGTGTFELANGTYSGNGTTQSITGLGFTPDLVIIKNDAAQYAVFRTSLMAGDRTAYLANAATVFTGGITAFGADGFTVGANATVNTAANTYYWTAYGGAARSDRSGGASDFIVGQYIGSGVDSTNVDNLPIDPDLVAVKQVGTQVGVWRTSNQVGDLTLYFSATAQAANIIQALNSDGFQRGTNAASNTSGSTYDYFAFKSGSKFLTGTYTGTGASQNITGAGMQSDHLWIKKTTGGTARAGVLRTSAQAGDAAQPFPNTATTANAVTALLSNGFTVNTSTLTNENTFAFQYAVWDGKVFSQSTYRLFENDDSTDVGAALAAANTPVTQGASNEQFRLRSLLRVDNANLHLNAANIKLQFVGKGSGSCASPTGGTPAAYSDVTIATAIAYYNTAAPADGAALTSNAGDPTDGGRTIVNQSYEESNNVTNAQAAITKGQDGHWDFSLVDLGVTVPTTYCFRLVRADGTLFDSYLQFPEITVPADSSQPSLLITSSATNPTSVSPIPITIEFSEIVTGFTVGDLSVGNGTAGNFAAVDGDTYTADISPLTSGLVTVDVAGSVAQDGVGNVNTAAPQFTITFGGRRRVIVSE